MHCRQDGEIAVMNQYLAHLLGCGTAEVYDQLENLLHHILEKKPLRAYGVTQEDLTKFAQSVMDTQGRLMANNFVPLDYDAVLSIYQKLY